MGDHTPAQRLSTSAKSARRPAVTFPAASDLHTGQVIAHFEECRQGAEFTALLSRLDEYYPTEAIIRLGFDNHCPYISKRTIAYMASRPDRLA